MSTLRQEAGATLMELLMGMSILIVVLSASLLAFNNFQSVSSVNARQNETQDRARNAVFMLSRQLRNLAGPDEGQPQAFDKISPYDIVFKTVNRVGPPSAGNLSNVQRVRYCLDSSRKLWTQVQQWSSATPPNPPSSTSCPDGGWANQRVIAQDLTNTFGGANRPLFVFDTADASAVNDVRVTLWVDVNPGRAPAESQLESGVFLRNQNRVPTSEFQWTAGASHHVILNASSSSDPEGQALTYTWKEGSQKICNSSVVVCDWVTTAGSHSVTLEVRDPAGLLGTTTQAVTAT
jgi:hypothetical protein